jgi:hypothetical protein
MPTQEDILRIVQQVAGQEKVQALANEYENAQEELRKYVAGLATFDAAMLKTDAMLQKHAMAAATAKEALESAQMASPGFTSGMRGNAMAMQQFAYGLQDFASSYTYGGARAGFMAISNNIQMIAANLGLGIKAMMGFTAAGIALPMLVGPAMKLVREMFGHPEELETYEDVLKRVRKGFEDMGEAARTAKEAVDAMFVLPDEAKAADAARKLIQGTDAPQINAALQAAAVNEAFARNKPMVQARDEKASAERVIAQINEALPKARADLKRAATPGETFNPTLREGLEGGIAARERQLKDLKEVIARSDNTLQKGMAEVQSKGLGNLRERLGRLNAADRQWVEQTLRGAGKGITADELAKLTPDQMKQARIAQQEANARQTDPIVKASDALRAGIGRFKAAGQKAQDANEQRAREKRQFDLEWQQMVDEAMLDMAMKDAQNAVPDARREADAARMLPGSAELQLGQLNGARPQDQAAELARMMVRAGDNKEAAQQKAAELVAQATEAVQAARQEAAATNESLIGFARMLQQEAMAERARNAFTRNMIRQMQGDNRFQRSLIPRGQGN